MFQAENQSDEAILQNYHTCVLHKLQCGTSQDLQLKMLFMDYISSPFFSSVTETGNS